MDTKAASFIDFFKEIPDHRINRSKLYPVEELLLLAFCGVIAGCDSWNDLELFGQTKLEVLQHYLPYKHGTPSDDTLRRFFRALDPTAFESCFLKWVRSFQLDLTDKVVAIDGKTSRRSCDNSTKALHVVSAFVSELGITLGQLKTADKSNEITAIPELLELLDISNAIITIDAMGCQKKIVHQITEKKANYLISLKGNQTTLNEDVRFFFEQSPDDASFSMRSDVEGGHGRIDIRQCRVTQDIEWLRERHPQWNNLNSIIEIQSTRDTGSETVLEKRYYISSLKKEATQVAEVIRSHWGIENKLHWVLDVTFQDDQSRIRKGNAPRNMAIIKKTALNLLQIIKKSRPRTSLKAMRKLAGWDPTFLGQVLAAKF